MDSRVIARRRCRHASPDHSSSSGTQHRGLADAEERNRSWDLQPAKVKPCPENMHLLQPYRFCWHT